MARIILTKSYTAGVPSRGFDTRLDDSEFRYLERGLAGTVALWSAVAVWSTDLGWTSHDSTFVRDRKPNKSRRSILAGS